MAEWKVSIERIAVFPHPGADRMDVARVGLHQLVIGKASGYSTGDLVAFAPKRSVLPLELWGDYVNPDTGMSYLQEGRVDSKRLRGELSEGVILSPTWVAAKLGMASLSDLPVGEDLSEKLGITLFEYPIPVELEGKVVVMRETTHSTHDVEGMAIFADDFTPTEVVIATENLNGSQVAVIVGEDGSLTVGSKGLFARGIAYLEDADNVYWRAVRRAGLEENARAKFPGSRVQAFGEVVPVPGGFSYGLTRDAPTLFLFRLEVNGVRLGHAEAMAALPNQRWAPVLYEGLFDRDALRRVAKGRETVSGYGLHIREGVVVEPLVPRSAVEGFPLLLKVVNPDFRDNDASPS